MRTENQTTHGLSTLLGKQVTLFCVNYIYTGRLAEVNDDFATLSEPAIVYETGPLNNKKWKDAQNLPSDWHVQLDSIESFGLLK